jgi:hypothetical protein
MKISLNTLAGGWVSMGDKNPSYENESDSEKRLPSQAHQASQDFGSRGSGSSVGTTAS